MLEEFFLSSIESRYLHNIKEIIAPYSKERQNAVLYPALKTLKQWYSTYKTRKSDKTGLYQQYIDFGNFAGDYNYRELWSIITVYQIIESDCSACNLYHGASFALKQHLGGNFYLCVFTLIARQDKSAIRDFVDKSVCAMVELAGNTIYRIVARRSLPDNLVYFVNNTVYLRNGGLAYIYYRLPKGSSYIVSLLSLSAIIVFLRFLDRF